MIIRSQPVGLLSVGLSSEFVSGILDRARWPLLAATFAAGVGIFVVGFIIARQITSPLEELVQTATDVTAGNLRRRSRVRSKDEIGLLSVAFNRMTEYLLHLIRQFAQVSGQRAAILDSLSEGVVVCDLYGRITLVNPTMRRLLNLSAEAASPQHFAELPLEPVTERVFNKQTDNLYALHNRILRVRGSAFTVSGANEGYVYIFQDLTDEVNIDRAKTNFIATISHEMRTPLTPLRGNLDMLRSGMAGTINDQQRAMIEDMRLQTSNMTRLVTNMIVVAELDAGALNIELEPTQVKPIVDKAAWPLRKALKTKNIELQIDLPEDLPMVLADTIQLRTIMEHLLDNAMKYTDQGSITVRGRQSDTHVQIDVIDTGHGIAPTLIDRVFDRFVRGEGDESNNRADRGIGLGLSIVKELVEYHHGQIWVTSQVGQGSTFSFLLRCANVSSEPDATSTTVAA